MGVRNVMIDFWDLFGFGGTINQVVLLSTLSETHEKRGGKTGFRGPTFGVQNTEASVGMKTKGGRERGKTKLKEKCVWSIKQTGLKRKRG